MALEELGLGLGGQRGEAQKVSYVDGGQRPIQVLGHSAILPPKLPDRCDAKTGGMRQIRMLSRPRHHQPRVKARRFRSPTKHAQT
jgi:hypothetical protein